LSQGETEKSYLDLIYGNLSNDNSSSSFVTKAHAVIILSLDVLWDIPSYLALIASIIDPRFKTFQWAPNQFNHAKRLF
ncbi:16440_t:CDS:2, partial [Gigaspora rosea]